MSQAESAHITNRRRLLSGAAAAVTAAPAVTVASTLAEAAPAGPHPDQALFDLEREFRELAEHPVHARADAAHTRMLEMVGPPQPGDDPDEREAAYRRASKECGCAAVDKEAELVGMRSWDVRDRVLATPATTAAGFAVKARVILAWCCPEVLQYSVEEHDLPEAGLVQLIDQLAKVEPPAASEGA